MGRNTIIKANIANQMHNVTIMTIYLLVLIGMLLPAGCQEQTTAEGYPPVPEPSVGREEVSVASVQAAATEPETEKLAPKIEFESLEYDFGEVGPETTSTGEFKFTNTGDAPLKIIKVDRCCGTVVILSKKEFAPGESGVLTVQYKAAPRPGMMRRKLYVNSNDKDSPRVILSIKAKIGLKVDYEPKRLTVSLKEQDPNAPAITLFSLDGRPFSITAIDSTGGCIMADYDASVEATKFVLYPQVNIERFRENPQGHLNIRLSHPECKKVTIFFEGLTRFTINPPQIMAFNSEPGKPIKRKIWVLNNYEEDFEIESTSSKNNTIKVLEQKKVRNGHQFEIQITPPAKEENQSLFTDEFLINIKGGERLEVICRGFYSRK